jgi:hypothetical protein
VSRMSNCLSWVACSEHGRSFGRMTPCSWHFALPFSNRVALLLHPLLDHSTQLKVLEDIKAEACAQKVLCQRSSKAAVAARASLDAVAHHNAVLITKAAVLQHASACQNKSEKERLIGKESSGPSTTALIKVGSE